MSTTFAVFRNNTDTLDYAAGTTIFSEGDPAQEMYVVRAGEVEILIDGEVVETVGVDAIFGELALIDAAPRSATARARSDCTLAPVSRKRFEFLVQQHPYFALEVMGVLAERLRRNR